MAGQPVPTNARVEKLENQEEVLSTVTALLVSDEMYEAAELLREADCAFEVTGYDNWNGGTDLVTLFIRLAASEFARLKPRKDVLEKQIDERLQTVISQISDDWYSVTLAPKIERQKNWRTVGGVITRVIRQNIFDGIRIERIHWSGSLEDTEFLERIFDLENLPSTDDRFQNAAGDIWQHRVNNPGDWPDDWVFSDNRLDLLKCSDDVFLRFLCEMVHPVVRPNRDEALRLVSHFNDQLREANWALRERELIAGRPRFVAERVGGPTRRAQSRARTVADALEAGWMHKEIQRLETAVERDPALAIGTAKELVESCCKTILTKRGKPPAKSDDLPKITKALVKELRLVPEGIPEQAKGAKTIKVLLSNFISITQGLAGLRGLYGSGHGRDGQYRGLEPRHARLAVAAAVAFIDFATETYHRRELLEADDKS